MSEKKIKTTSNKNIKLVVIVALLIAFIVLIPVGYALFSDHKQDTATAKVGKIEVILKENWPERGESDPNGEPGDKYDEFGIKKYTKKIWGQSVGDLPAYVRVRCIPIVEYYVEPATGETEGKWITAPVPQENIQVLVTAKDNSDVTTWIQGGDYWYYKNILPAGADTASMTVDWQVVELPSELSGKRIRSDVRVILEYSQTTNNKWKEIFKIDALPEGVEEAE